MSIRLGREDIKGDDILAVTNLQAKKLAKAHENGKEDIKLKPKEVKQLQLGLGFMMSEGVVLVGLANSLK